MNFVNEDTVMDALELLDTHDIDTLTDNEIDAIILDIVNTVFDGGGKVAEKKELTAILKEQAENRVKGIDDELLQNLGN